MTGRERLAALGIDATAVIRICAKFGAHDVAVFGSVSRGEANERSDLDLLVDVEPGRTLLDLVDLEMELTDALQREVDVVTRDGLSRHLGPRILREAIAL